MPVITEGTPPLALTFTFSAAWSASKYDDWIFYRNQFLKVCTINGGNKAVDIVAYNGNDAWLIEIKDYRRHQRTKVIDLADEVAKKVFDTLAGLVAAKFNANDPQEKSYASSILNASNINVVLHLEQPVKQSKLFPRAINPTHVLQKLKKQIKAIDAHPEVLEISTTNPGTHWTVT